MCDQRVFERGIVSEPTRFIVEMLSCDPPEPMPVWMNDQQAARHLGIKSGHPARTREGRQQNRPADPDLADLLDRWPTLPADVKAAILALPTDVKAE